jgi:uncharacterized phage protein gp47/JayE
MPYPSPTLQALLDEAATDISSSDLAGSDGFLPRSLLNLMGIVQAGFAFGHYDAIAYAARQGTPFYATDEWLEGWASLKNVFRKDGTASGADGNSSAVFTGTAGAVLPIGTPVNRGDAFAYLTAAEGAVVGTTVTVPIEATTIGSLGNCPAGTALTLGTGISNIGATGSAATAITGGTEQELDDDLRTRMFFAYQNPPAGGSQTDYEGWALAVPGITRAWCSPVGAGAGTVVVWFMLDIAEAAAGGFPQGSDGVAALETRDVPATGVQLTLANALYPLRPVTALVYACAPVAQPVNYSITELSPNTTAIQAGIVTALQAMHLRKAIPGGTLWPSDWNEAVAAVPGILHFNIPAPAVAVVATTGNLPTVGAVTYAS